MDQNMEWHCAKCGDDEPETGGPFAAICIHVAEGGGIDVASRTRDDGVSEKDCVSGWTCPTAEICVGCWDNLYDAVAVSDWWPSSAALPTEAS